MSGRYSTRVVDGERVGQSGSSRHAELGVSVVEVILTVRSDN
jgi:hypothetical protein